MHHRKHNIHGFADILVAKDIIEMEFKIVCFIRSEKEDLVGDKRNSHSGFTLENLQ